MTVDLVDVRQHYRCAFSLRPASNRPPDVRAVVKCVLDWLQRRRHLPEPFPLDELLRPGAWRGPEDRSQVVTDAFDPDGSDSHPMYWSVHLEHPCSEHLARRWHTDIGLCRMDGSDEIRFCLRTAHGLRPGYVGDEPDLPQPSTPAIVTRLCHTNAWHAYAGELRLSGEPYTVGDGDGERLWLLLCSELRELPVVLVSRESGSGEPLLDPGVLAKLLTATAHVSVADNAAPHWAFSDSIPDQYRCHDGAVRIYFPPVRPQHPRDFHRHRFYLPHLIRWKSPAVVQEEIVRALAQRNLAGQRNRVSDNGDVAALRQAHRRSQLSRVADMHNAEREEWVNLILGENERLDSALRSASEAGRAMAEELEEARGEIEEQQEEIRQLSGRLTVAERRLDRSDAGQQHREQVAEAIDSIEMFPADLPAMLETAEALYGDRIAFTNRAKSSAREASISRHRQAHREAWRCLRAMAVVLNQLHRSAVGPKQIEEQFRSQTGFELATTEGATTRDQKKLMKLREQDYKGQARLFEAHVKYGDSPPALLRVHYLWDAEEGRIIVGHCGDHLDTAGTRKRR